MSNKQIYCRLFGYSATLLMHITNLIYMRYTIRAANVVKDSADDEGIRVFRRLEYRYFTTWTVGLQIGYSIYGLFCEMLILMNKADKNYRLPKVISDFREILFGGLVWPCSWVVSIVFWTLYHYDRRLIYPDFLDKILTSLSNHVIHSAIVPVVVWEVIFRPRKKPRSHARNLMQLFLHIIVYGCVFHFTYFEHGIWLYPIFGELIGSIHFFLIHVYIGVFCLLNYYSQWWLNDIVNGSREICDKKVK